MDRLDNIVPAFTQGQKVGRSVVGNLAFGYGLVKAYQYGMFSVEGLVIAGAIAAIGYTAANIAKSKVLSRDENGNARTVWDLTQDLTGMGANAVTEVSGLATGTLFATKQLLLPRPQEIRQVNDDMAKNGTAFFRNALQVAVPVGLSLGLAAFVPTIGLGAGLCRASMMILGSYAGTKIIENPAVDASISVISETSGAVLGVVETIKTLVCGARDSAVQAHGALTGFARATRETVGTLASAAETVNQFTGRGTRAPVAEPTTPSAPPVTVSMEDEDVVAIPSAAHARLQQDAEDGGFEVVESDDQIYEEQAELAALDYEFAEAQ